MLKNVNMVQEILISNKRKWSYDQMEEIYRLSWILIYAKHYRKKEGNRKEKKNLVIYILGTHHVKHGRCYKRITIDIACREKGIISHLLFFSPIIPPTKCMKDGGAFNFEGVLKRIFIQRFWYWNKIPEIFSKNKVKYMKNCGAFL